MSKADRLLKRLYFAPSTASELGVLTGWGTKICSAHLTNLTGAGFTYRKGVKREPAIRQGGHNESWLYALTERGEVRIVSRLKKVA